MKRSKPRLTALTYWLICSTWFFTGCQQTSETTTGDAGSPTRLDAQGMSQDQGTQDVMPGSDASGSLLDAQGLVDAHTGSDQGPILMDLGTGVSFDARPQDAGQRPDISAPNTDAAQPMADMLPSVDQGGVQPDISVQKNDAALLPDDAAPRAVDAQINDSDMALSEPDAALAIPDSAVDEDRYPQGPYGVEIGQIIADLNFVDWQDREYRLSDMRREPNTQIIAIITLAGWCPTCAQKMEGLRMVNAALRELGALTVVSLYQNANFQAATARDADGWRRQHELELPVVSDGPQALGPYFNPFGRNIYILIDAQSMEILHLSQGFQNNVLEQELRERLIPNDP